MLPIDTTPSPMVLAFATGLALVTGLLFGAAPAWFATRTDPIEALRGSGRTAGDRASFARTALLVAQAADTLLSMTGIAASFVISERPDGLIGISARSLGEINVQLVMERLGGGGHLTNAAVQIEGTLKEAETKLLAVLEEMHKEEGLFE